MLSIIAVDLDDTIVRSDGVIAQRTIDALLAWEAGGERVVIATRRPPRSAQDHRAAAPPAVDLLQRGHHPAR
ncbi:MAG: HAD hydrolase family protein [Caldilineaceae bacterium]